MPVKNTEHSLVVGDICNVFYLQKNGIMSSFTVNQHIDMSHTRCLTCQ